jgi:hypothetical protein
MSEIERMDLERRAFLKKFAMAAAVVPIIVTTGCLPSGGSGGSYGYNVDNG